jgi:DNA-binding transcriptional LysR family regulator
MELRHLAYFLAVAQEGNFTRAADRALVAQPAISQQILRLERELGEKLFDRTSSGARLTEAGRVLLPHARAILAGADRARDALTSLQGLMTGRLALGSVQTPPTALAELLGRFRENHPGVQLSVREAHTEPLASACAARPRARCRAHWPGPPAADSKRPERTGSRDRAGGRHRPPRSPPR